MPAEEFRAIAFGGRWPVTSLGLEEAKSLRSQLDHDPSPALRSITIARCSILRADSAAMRHKGSRLCRHSCSNQEQRETALACGANMVHSASRWSNRMNRSFSTGSRCRLELPESRGAANH